MTRGIYRSNRGSVGIVILVALLLLSFGVLLVGFINMYKEYRAEGKEQQEEFVKMTDIKVASEEESKKAVNALSARLTQSMAENDALKGNINNLQDSIKKLRVDLENANTQVQFQKAEQDRIESSMMDLIALYGDRVEALDRTSDDLRSALEIERATSKEAEDSLKNKVKSLKEQLKESKALVNDLQAKVLNLGKSSLVKETSKMHYNLANHYAKSKLYDKAVKEYKRAIELVPSDADAHYNLALVYDVYLTEYVLARNHYLKCLELNPKFKNRKEVQERITYLSFSESVQISPTQAKQKTPHKLMVDNVYNTQGARPR